MATKQQKILLKGTIFALLVALIFLFSRYGPKPFSVLGPMGEHLGEFEETALLGQMEEPLRTMMLLGIHTGLRLQSEGLTLRWLDIDMKRKLVTIPAAYAKSGKTRSVPLNAVIRAALERLKEGEQGQGDYVFSKRDGSPYRSIRTALNNAVNRAKLTNVTIHTLRHTFASRLTMVGVDLRTIQELGGWSNLDMVQRYSHLSQNHKAEAVEKIAQNSTTLFTTLGEERHAANHVNS